MNKPPDLQDPGGGMIPPANNYVTITTHSIIGNESGMDTDASTTQINTRKRSRNIKICKQCNKKKRKHAQSVDGKTGCLCANSDSNSDYSSKDTSLNKPNAIPSDFSVPSPSNVPVPQVVATVARNLYKATDSAPFIVHVQREIKSPDDGITLHPVSFGKLLQKSGFQNIVNGSVKRIGRNKIELAFINFSDANSFVSSNVLSSNNLKAFIPSFNVTRMGLIRGVPSEWTPEEVIDNVSVPDGCGKILKVRRINYKIMVDGSPVWKPTQSIVVTFDGQVLPSRIFVCYNSLPVDLYTYPTIQCYNCCRYGHTKIQCRSKPRCYKCGLDHAANNCTVNEENTVCCLCSGAHFAINKTCPEFARQKQIKLLMAEKSMSYGEAAKLTPPALKSYADIVKSVSNRNEISRPHETSVASRITAIQRPNQTSYKKTVILNRRSPGKVGMGYDRNAHQNIVKDFNIPSSQDGCALNTNSNDPLTMSTTDIIKILIDTLTKSNIQIPSTVASIFGIYNNSSTINDGSPSESSAMELQKCSS